ncbi:hypothetical protein D3C75_1135840 [compost metagenome]
MVMPDAVQIAHAVSFYPQHFRIFLRHPGRTRTAWSSQKSINPVLGEGVQNTVQPIEGEYAFLRLQRYPGKDAYRHYIAARQLHHADILTQHFRIFQPLLRIIIGSMQHDWNLAADWG